MSEFGDFDAMYGSVNYTGATVLDIGADFGSTARWFLERGAARVVASERNPEFVSRLWEYAAVEPRVKVTPALSAENVRNILHDHDPTIVKVDCEGCEALLLDVDADILRRPSAWVVETHTVALFDAFVGLFSRLGYKVERVDRWPSDPKAKKVPRVIVARKPRHAVRGLITGMGRSGSMWTARALRDCCGLDARHESVPFPHIGKIRHIEVNSAFVWAVGSWASYPAITTVHLVRDGRDSVASNVERVRGTPFARWVWEWASKNDYLLTQIDAKLRFRLEDLIGENPRLMAKLAAVFGAELDIEAWEKAKAQPQNAGPGLYPRWQRWPDELTREFWRIAGDVMERCGYPREGT